MARPRVLLYGPARDPHVAAIAREFRRRGTTIVVMRPHAFPREAPLSLSISPDQASSVGVEADVAWLGASRRIQLDGGLPGAARRFARQASRQVLFAWMRACPFPWVNDPDATVRADDKFHQLAVARRLGFHVPRTLLSNDPERIRAFANATGPLIAKSFSGNDGLPARHRILTTRLRPSDLRDGDSLAAAPAMFQEDVAKRSELRVTVVGDDAYAVRIFSQNSARTETDWRRYGPALTYERARLDASTARRCLQMARSVGLDYGGIDLIETPDDRVVFLEINSLPAWLWLEDATKVPITRVLADLLLRRADEGKPRGRPSATTRRPPPRRVRKKKEVEGEGFEPANS